MVYNGKLIHHHSQSRHRARSYDINLLNEHVRNKLIQFLPLSYRYSDNLELEDAVHTAILTLKESFEGQMTEENIEIGICNHDGFKRLSTAEVKDYLASVQ